MFEVIEPVERYLKPGQHLFDQPPFNTFVNQVIPQVFILKNDMSGQEIPRAYSLVHLISPPLQSSVSTYKRDPNPNGFVSIDKQTFSRITGKNGFMSKVIPDDLLSFFNNVEKYDPGSFNRILEDLWFRLVNTSENGNYIIPYMENYHSTKYTYGTTGAMPIAQTFEEGSSDPTFEQFVITQKRREGRQFQMMALLEPTNPMIYTILPLEGKSPSNKFYQTLQALGFIR